MKPNIISENGQTIITRPEGRPPIEKVLLPMDCLRSIGYIGSENNSIIIQGLRDYCDNGRLALDAVNSPLVPLLLQIIAETEESAFKGVAASANARNAAVCRWGTRYDNELPAIDIPEIQIPNTLGLAPIIRGGVSITPNEYMRVVELFLFRGFRQGEHRAFYGYWGAKKWNAGAIDGEEARWNRALRWKQSDGQMRFENDPAAHDLINSIFWELPTELRVYMLSDGVMVSINSSNNVSLNAPAKVNSWISQSTAAKQYLKNYAMAHHATSDNWCSTDIPFYVDNNTH